MTDPCVPAHGPRAAGASTFAVAAWRPPLRPQIWAYALMIPPGAGPTVWIGYPLMRLGVPAWPALWGRIGGWAAAAAVVLAIVRLLLERLLG